MNEVIEEETHEAIAFGSAGVLIGDDNGLKNLTKLVKVTAQGFALSLPSEASDEDLGVGGVTERGIRELETRTGTRS